MKPGPKPKTPTCHPERKHYGKGLCASCYNKPFARARQDAEFALDPDAYRKSKALYMREWTQRVKVSAFALLGGVCALCGFSDSRALEVDHINGRTEEEKKRRSSADLYSRMITGKRTLEDLQLLCSNCHSIKTFENMEHPRKY